MEGVNWDTCQKTVRRGDRARRLDGEEPKACRFRAWSVAALSPSEGESNKESRHSPKNMNATVEPLSGGAIPPTPVPSRFFLQILKIVFGAGPCGDILGDGLSSVRRVEIRLTA